MSKSALKVPGDDPRLVDSCVRVMGDLLFLDGRFKEINDSYLALPGLHMAQTSSEIAKLINKAIASKYPVKKERNPVTKELLEEAKQRLLLLEELDWCQGNERACYWVWATVSRGQFFSAPIHPIVQPQGIQNLLHATSYSQLRLKSEPSSSKERFEEVVKFFDGVGQPLDWQRSLVAHLKNLWGQIFSSRKPFSWLKQDDEDQIRWAWEYFSKLDIWDDKPTVLGFNPINSKERYLAIYAAFDLWDSDINGKRLFLIDFNKAWQQKKHRDSRVGKKVCNLVLREEVKNKLDTLAAQRGKKLNQLVEELIENEYASIAKNDWL